MTRKIRLDKFVNDMGDSGASMSDTGASMNDQKTWS